MWEFENPQTLVAFCQYSGNAAPGNIKDSKMEFRGREGAMYVRNSSWEALPKTIADFPPGYAGGKGYGNPVYREGPNRARGRP